MTILTVLTVTAPRVKTDGARSLIGHNRSSEVWSQWKGEGICNGELSPAANIPRPAAVVA